MSEIDVAGMMRELALGEVGAKEAKSLFAEVVAHSPESAARKAYPALQEVAWRFIRARSAPDDLDDWIAVYRFCERLFDKSELPETARQIEALGDMVARTARYADLQPPDSTLGRRHVLPLLEQLAKAGGQLRRKDLKRFLALEEANLSRLIALLEAGGLVVRKTAGRESMIALTTEGQRSVPEPQPAQDIFAALGVHLKDAAGLAVALTDTEGHLVASSGFEQLVGLPASAAVDLVADNSKSSGADLQTADKRWMRSISLPTSKGKSASLWIDISDLKATADRAQQSVVRLEAELAAVKASREAILAHQAEDWAFQNAVGRRVGARISGIKRSAALAHTAEALASQTSGFLQELEGIQSVVLENPPFSGTHSQPQPVNALTVFEEVVKLASFFSEEKLKTSTPGALPEMPIVPEPVLDTFRKCAVQGVQFRELKMSRKEDAVIFVGLTSDAHLDLSLTPALMPYSGGPGMSGVFVQRTVENGASGIEIVAPISGGTARKIA